MTNPYLPNDTDEIRQKLLKTIGIKNTDELFSDIPSTILLKKSLSLPVSLSEAEVRRAVEGILKKNSTVKELISFLGGGVWPHYVPAVVDNIASRSEFLTSYTPYQPELNQGVLQALFEYQSLICELVKMDVANCSMYDWASSLAEAARMTSRITGKNVFLVPHFISPERITVLKSYAEPAEIRVVEVKQSANNGQIDLEDLKQKMSSETAGVYIENPSYLGYVMNNASIVSEIVHDAGGLFVVGVDPMSLGVLKPPGDYGADIVVGEGQPLGNHMSFGGGLLGILSCKDNPYYIRQLPGRVVGMTTTIKGDERGFCFALQTREQHIRREKATSNICTNETLCAIRAAVYMSLMGRKGFETLGNNILIASHYTAKILSEIGGVEAPSFKSEFFKEFTVNFDRTSKSVDEINNRLLRNGIVGGHSLKTIFPELGNSSLYCVTELHSRNDIETLQTKLKEIIEG
ncbi:MAG: glycine dehydrogenase subunit 1 [Thermoproteota archaeon]|nr:glycine dehydrogenase subunit 1 [Thermoproteota archaeon]